MVNTALVRRTSPKNLRVIFGVLLGLLVLSFTLGTGVSGAHAATAVCKADAATACFNGTIKGVGEGVEITVDGNGQTVTVQTDKDGKWNAAVTAAGSYTITLDEKSLPAGVTIDGDATQTRDITLGANGGAIFKVSGADSGATAAPDANAGASAEGFNWERFAQQFVSGLRLGLLLALASIGLSLIYGTTGLSSFSHAEQVTLGGLLGYTFANVLGLNIVLTTIIVVIITGATGWLQDAFIWKPLRKKGLSLNQMIIVTIGLALALQYTF
ncbi:MAG: High-affinity branched-chain amino acid transport system permease protein LivH, partial [Actinomycetota bacterium]